jgi:hypothetical protein
MLQIGRGIIGQTAKRSLQGTALCVVNIITLGN